MKEEKKPFFAQYLESIDENDLNSVKAGKTNKWPSDTDEDLG